MPLPPEVVARLHEVHDVIGLRFLGSRGNIETYYFRVTAVERPNNLFEFSLGSASALNTTGTGWQLIDDSNAVDYLEPANDKEIRQVFYGVAPSYARVYRQFPSGTDRGSLITTRSIGDPVGYTAGSDSPYRSPAAETEIYVVKGIHGAFNGYHPYANPSSVTIRMSFHVSRYQVEQINEPTLSAHALEMAKIVSMGGLVPIRVPTWVDELS